ncbi:MAG: FHA domain-containing protein [Anaerolineae bacterium]|nr:FHA domain-containing protein [Candidatus Roseilinea sp.]MDW8448970.1 FHA domain-containing protein [Anaerolineae bacterium]
MGEPNAGAPRVRVQDELGRVVNVFLLPPDGEGLTVGRALHSDVSLPSKAISPLHLRIRWDSTSGRVTVTDLGSTTGTYLDERRLSPEMPYPWGSSQRIRAGGYTFKLIMPAPVADAPSNPVQPAGVADSPKTLAQPPRRFGLALLAGAFAFAALALAIYSFLSRPAEILSLALATGESGPAVRFQVSNAQRVELLVNGRPADPARLTFDPRAGAGVYAVGAGEEDFALVAYNRLGWPTTSRLIYPSPTEMPRPTFTPLPAEVGLAVFAFNGVNKVNDLSDVILNKGDPLLIEWNVVNAEDVELQPAGTFRPQDAVRVAPNETTVYTLIARNPFGEVRRSVKVIVVDAQATAAANATASAIAQATRDAEAAAQAQIAATATAASQATATAIADAFARAQQAATAKATQDALAILSATSTAVARETAQAQSAAIAQATASAQQAASAMATAVVQATAQAMEARYSQYSGIWVNDDPTTDGVTRLVIGNAGPTITVQAFARCRPRDCDWGVRSQAFTGEPFSIAFAFGDGVTRQLTFARVGDKLRVTDTDSRGPIRTYSFSPAKP